MPADSISGYHGTTDSEQLLQRIHTNLHNKVVKEVEKVAHWESCWSAQELTKRIVRYIYNSAKKENLRQVKDWEELVNELVDGFMHSYSAACGDKKWFFEIDLVPAFTSAAWEILKLQAEGQNSRHVKFSKLREVVVNVYAERLDRILLNKAVWHATSATFGSDDSKTQTKVYNALHKAYQGALDECIMDSRPLDALKKVEMFTKRWIDDSMRRAWSSIEGSERIITLQSVITLFRKLVAPFGDDHPFSCVPANLIDNIGKPPKNWAFIKHTVSNMFMVWRQETAGPSSGKRRKTKSSHAPGGFDKDMAPLELHSAEDEPGQHALRAAARRTTVRGEDDDMPLLDRNSAEEGPGQHVIRAAERRATPRERTGAQPAQHQSARQRQRLLQREEPEEPLEDEEVSDSEGDVHPDCTCQEERQHPVRREHTEEPPKDKEVVDSEGDAHPECTSQEDCCGSAADRLVRHWLDGEEGDIYCHRCWEFFLEYNPQLVGVWQDTQEPYK